MSGRVTEEIMEGGKKGGKKGSKGNKPDWFGDKIKGVETKAKARAKNR